MAISVPDVSAARGPPPSSDKDAAQPTTSQEDGGDRSEFVRVSQCMGLIRGVVKVVTGTRFII